jgi:MFS family permease
MRSNDNRNMALNAVGEALWGLLGGLITSSTVLVMLLRRHGASTLMIGAITAIEIGSSLAPQIVGTLYLSSRSGRQRRLIVFHLVGIIPFLVAIGAFALAGPALSPALVRWGVLACYAGFMCGIGVVLAVWFDWLSGVFPQATRGRALGLGFGLSSVLNFTGGLLAGKLLALQDHVPSFSLLYLGAAVFGTASILTFGLIRDPHDADPDPVRRPSMAELTGWFRQSLADRNFRRFLAGRLLTTAGFCIVPFLAVHYASPGGGGLTAAEVVTSGIWMPAGAAIANLVFGWIGDRSGHRVGIAAGAALQALAILAALLVPGRTGCALVYFAVGLCAASAGVSHQNMIFETCPHGHRLSHITIANLVLSAGVVFPLLAGVVVEAFGLAVLLRASFAVSAAALLWILLLVREPRQATPPGNGGRMERR